MYICHCRAVTDQCIRAAIEAGARDPGAVASRCGAGEACGGCLPALMSLLDSYGLLDEEARCDAEISAA